MTVGWISVLDDESATPQAAGSTATADLEARVTALVESFATPGVVLWATAVLVAVWIARSGRARAADTPAGVTPPASGALVALMALAGFYAIGGASMAVLTAMLPQEPPLASPVAALFATAGAVVLAAVVLRAVGVRGRAVGLGERAHSWPIALGLAVYVATIPLFALASQIRYTEPELQSQVIQLLGEDDPVYRALFLVSVALGAPVFEELLFRGVLLAALRRWFGPSVAVVVSAAAFALVHPPSTHVPIFWLGLVLGGLYHYTGSLAAPIVLHGFHNGLQFALVSAAA